MSFADHLDILYEDNHCLAVNKPAGWPTTHFDGREETVDRLVKAYLKEKYQKPGNVFLGVVHRLDKPVSGALLFARTSKAAARLCEQFRAGMVEKVYWAVVETNRRGHTTGGVAPWLQGDSGSLDDWLKKDEPHHRVEVVAPQTTGAQLARLFWQVKGRHNGLIWLELRPHTGRKHQLRVQLASRGGPIYGDAKYGSDHPFGHAIALHARSLTFLHPVTKEPITVKADVPTLWRGRFAYLLHATP
ncbi:MAG: RluA family pseudouridine synthase [Gemmataceae bacterium]|nr:RluA family pseudouridine synthase [Gemmata sp.]MDW8196630.1 RluA family pseudouridine synthase [Gemmataceae bacterium]